MANTHVELDMPIRWKLDELLTKHDISVYRLEKTLTELGRSISGTRLYDLKNKPDTNANLETVDAILAAVERITGKRFEITDLLVRE